MLHYSHNSYTKHDKFTKKNTIKSMTVTTRLHKKTLQKKMDCKRNSLIFKFRSLFLLLTLYSLPGIRAWSVNEMGEETFFNRNVSTIQSSSSSSTFLMYVQNSNNNSILKQQRWAQTHNHHEEGEGYEFKFKKCHVCLRNEIKEASLESIKAHVLKKLGFEHPPNMTKYPKVPNDIIQLFTNKKHPEIEPDSKEYDFDSNSEEMQGDEPNYRDKSGKNKGYDNMEEAEYFHVKNRIYAIPLRHQVRHRHHANLEEFSILNYRLTAINEWSHVAEALLNVYVHGKDTVNQAGFNLKYPQDTKAHINMTVHRIIRREKSFNQWVNRYEGPIPKGKGRYIKINVIEMVTDWFRNPQNNHGALIKTYGQYSQKLVQTNPNDEEYAPFIEIVLSDNRKKRSKRNLSLNCNENDNETRCCRYPLTVDFEKFGWDWIIAPKRYEANYCLGECMMSFLPKYEHTHVMQLSISAIPCCSPKKMSPIRLLYFDLSYNVIYSTIPNMIVEKCGCS